MMMILAVFMLMGLGAHQAAADPWVTPQIEGETGIRVHIADKLFVLPTLKYSTVFEQRGHVLGGSVSLVRRLKHEDWLAFRIGLTFDPAHGDALATTLGAEKKETVLYGFVSFYGMQEVILFDNERLAHGFYSGDFILLVPLRKDEELGLREANTALGRTVLEMDVEKENRFGMNPLKLDIGLHAEHFGWDITWGPHIGVSRYRCNWSVQLQYHQGTIKGRDGRTFRLTGAWYF